MLSRASGRSACAPTTTRGWVPGSAFHKRRNDYQMLSRASGRSACAPTTTRGRVPGSAYSSTWYMPRRLAGLVPTLGGGAAVPGARAVRSAGEGGGDAHGGAGPHAALLRKVSPATIYYCSI
eukprot:1189921-Prorocentrum_minimum.AAC.2